MNTPTDPDGVIRKLKVEAAGDFWKGLLKPKIRLIGRWLERAGFRSGNHVYVRCVASGLIELRSSEIGLLNAAANPAAEPPKTSVQI